MFNLLGSIFGYGQSSPSVASTESSSSSTSVNNNEEASQSTSGLVVASTTPTVVNQSTQTKVVDLTNSVAGATTSSQASLILNNSTTNTTSHTADWVIVDRSEAAVEKCKPAAVVDVSTSMTASIDDLQKSTVVAPAVANTNITDSVMLGSFFDKNANEDEEFNKKYGNAANMHQTKDWLITPLPCLTSITASQRSIVDNDPMENLLIEHPSMSVFVAATSSAESDDDDDTATLEDEEMNVFYFLFDIKEEEEKKQQPAALREVEKNVMVKSQSEKRKALGSPKICDSKPPGGKRHQKHKKNKKSTQMSPNSSVSPASSSSTINGSPNTTGKENLTVLLPHDMKKQSASGAQSLVSALLLNKNQMKRANKNSVFKNTSANNVKHRKYHKLQQPFQQSSRPVF
jgi:hypothetical protein